MASVLKVQVTTNLCSENEAYSHEVPVTVEKIMILEAIETLYGAEGVTFISIESVEEE